MDLKECQRKLSDKYIGKMGVHGVGMKKESIIVLYNNRKKLPKAKIEADAQPWPVEFIKGSIPVAG
jgi:hypothetical protein